MLHRRRDCRYNECSYACPDMAPTIIHLFKIVWISHRLISIIIIIIRTYQQ